MRALERDAQQDRQPCGRAELVHARIADAIPVDHHAGRDAQLCARSRAASRRSCSPNGVGSVTSSRKSAPRTGFDHRTRGARRRVEDHHAAPSPAGIAHFLSWRMTGVAIGSPTFSTPRREGDATGGRARFQDAHHVRLLA